MLLRHDQREQAFAAKVQRVFGCKLGLELEPMAQAQHVEFIQCTFARADTWSLWQQRLGRIAPPQPDRHYPARLGALLASGPYLTHRLCLYPPREAGSLAPLLRSPSRLPRFPGRDSDLTDSERMMKPQRYLIPLLLMAQGATAAEAVGPCRLFPLRCAPRG